MKTIIILIFLTSNTYAFNNSSDYMEDIDNLAAMRDALIDKALNDKEQPCVEVVSQQRNKNLPKDETSYKSESIVVKQK